MGLVKNQANSNLGGVAKVSMGTFSQELYNRSSSSKMHCTLSPALQYSRISLLAGGLNYSIQRHQMSKSKLRISSHLSLLCPC